MVYSQMSNRRQLYISRWCRKVSSQMSHLRPYIWEFWQVSGRDKTEDDDDEIGKRLELPTKLMVQVWMKNRV